MKVALITDTHFGAKKGNEVYLESQMRFFINQFIPYLKKHGIDTIIHLGDFFDNRINIDSRVLNNVIDLFETHLKDFKVHVIVGNHDSYFDTTIETNSVKTLNTFSNVTTYSNISEIELGGKKILLCPWVTKKDQFISTLDQYSSDVCMGHFEIAKCPMFKGQPNEHGLEQSIFLSRFKLTLSGHFHTRSETKFNGNRLIYIGNAFQMTRSDIDDERGFSILDLSTLKIKFVENSESMKYVSYNYPEVLTKENVYNNHVDISVVYDERYDEAAVQSYIERLESFGPALPINLKTINRITIETTDDIESTSISDLIKEYLQKSDIEIDRRDPVEKLILGLYEECNSEN
jgi:DNA repair exonuclease SbcCD nuclease subunit